MCSVKPSTLELHRPTTVGEALSLLREYGEDAKPLAGGQSLVPMLNLRLAAFDHLIDLNAVNELQLIEDVGEAVRVGATVHQAAAERSEAIRARVPLVARAIPNIGHFQIRNRGTVGGSIAHADPAAELPAVALALDARAVIATASGTRVTEADEFLRGRWTNSMAPDELLVAVEFPVWQAPSGFALSEVARRHGDFAMVGTICAIAVGHSGAVDRVRVVVFGVGERPRRALTAEAAIREMGAGIDPTEIARLAFEELMPESPTDEMERYRQRAGEALLRRTVQVALKEAMNGDQ